MASDRKFNCDLGGRDDVLWGTLVVDVRVTSADFTFTKLLVWSP